MEALLVAIFSNSIQVLLTSRVCVYYFYTVGASEPNGVLEYSLERHWINASIFMQFFGCST